MGVQLTYVGVHEDGVEIADTGQFAPKGEPVDVDEALAGRPPSGEQGTDGYDPGEGLLAQPDNWQLAEPARRGAATAEPPVEPTTTDGGEDR